MQHTSSSNTILWLIILGLLGIGGYMIISSHPELLMVNSSPTSERQDTLSRTVTSEWKTYRNTTYGFEFRYPNNRTAYESIDMTHQQLIPAGPESSTVAISHQDERYVFVTDPGAVIITVVPDATDSQTWFAHHLNDYASQAEIKSIDTITFEGKKALEVWGERDADRLYRLIIIQMDNYLIVIHQNIKSTLLDDVIRTFRVTR